METKSNDLFVLSLDGNYIHVYTRCSSNSNGFKYVGDISCSILLDLSISRLTAMNLRVGAKLYSMWSS